MAAVCADSIYALSSGGLPSGVAVIRVSGPSVSKLIEAIIRRDLEPRYASLAKLRDPTSGEVLDEALCLFFPGPSSFTGEDVLELHCHGGVATVKAVLRVLSEQIYLRAAEPGEFSRRAFENGRMDLTTLEGLSDLIQAQTEAQRRLALSHAGGALRSQYDDWRAKLIRIRALIEADFDFSDEEDVPGSVSDLIWPDVRDLHSSITDHLNDDRKGEIIREGYKIALIGPPNAGKSSLLNALAKRDVAIVTAEAGTTRDVIEVSLDIAGHWVVASDTAGLRETDSVIEQEGVRRAHLVASEADLVFWLDADGGAEKSVSVDGAVVVHSKSDLLDSPAPSKQLSVSSVSEGGTDRLVSYIESRLQEFSSHNDLVVLSRLRHREALSEVKSALALSLQSDLSLELRSEHLRQAADWLGRATGRIDVEDLLDVIFSEFCVGK